LHCKHKNKALAALLPPKKDDVLPGPAVVDEVPFETSDLLEVRQTSSSSHERSSSTFFFDHGFAHQFGGDDDDDDDDDDEGAWVDDEEDEGGDPAECRAQ
jgi:DnaJ homolog subfamily A member 2